MRVKRSVIDSDAIVTARLYAPTHLRFYPAEGRLRADTPCPPLVSRKTTASVGGRMWTEKIGQIDY